MAVRDDYIPKIDREHKRDDNTRERTHRKVETAPRGNDFFWELGGIIHFLRGYLTGSTKLNKRPFEIHAHCSKRC